MKRTIALLLAAVMTLSLVACGSKTATETPSTDSSAPTETSNLAGTKLEIATRLEAEKLDNLKSVIAAFEEETGVEVTLTAYTDADYESALKTRMASGELPDVFETHGWSRLRYGEYLYPVNDEPWYANQTEAAKGVLEGDGGVAYALCIAMNVSGLVCNKTLADSLGIDVYEIKTYADLEEACKIAIDAGIVPFVNYSDAGDLATWAGQFTSYDDALYPEAEAQLNGTYNWESYMSVLEWFAKMLDMGCFWEDRSTMDSTDEAERMATNKSLFSICDGTSYAERAYNMNPDNEIVLIAAPAITESASQYIFTGEAYAIGAWKDSKNLEAARAYLAFCAENGTPLCDRAPAITTVDGNHESYAYQASMTALEHYPDVKFVNLWDREYMPSGMWGVFAEAVGMLYADHSPENLVAIQSFLRDNYNEKYAAAHG